MYRDTRSEMMRPKTLQSLRAFLFPVIHHLINKEHEMKVDIEKLFTTLGLNLGLIAVFSAVLYFFGVSLDLVLTIAGSMVGLQLIISLCVNVLKWAGAITDGTAGVWSAGFNAAGIVVIAVVLSLNPAFDFTALDAQLIVIARFGALIFGYMVQIAGTKYMHQAVTYGLGVRTFSNKLSLRSA